MYTPIGDKFEFVDSLIVAIISILIVFAVLVVIISIASVFSKVLINLDNRNNIKPRKENKLLDEDEDAVAAVLVASIDYYNETKKHAKLVKITKEGE